MTADISSLNCFTQLLTGARVTRVFAGPNTGSNLSIRLQLGSIIDEPERRLREHALTTAELALFIECTWRIGRSKSMLASSVEFSEITTSAYKGIGPLVGSAVSECTIRPPFFNLSVTFDTGLRLELFCDRMVSEDYSNYTIETFNATCEVGPGSLVVVTQKAPSVPALRIVTDG